MPWTRIELHSQPRAYFGWSQRVRQTPLHVHGGFAGAAHVLRRPGPRSSFAGPAPCGGCALARLRGWRSHGTSATRLVGFAANEGGAARRALFRVEHRASDSPAQRRAGERAERAVGLGARGRAIRARRPHSGAWARRAWASCSPPPPVLASHRPGARAVPHALLRPHECHAISPARCPRRAT